MLWPVNFTLAYVGYEVLTPFVAYGVEAGLRYSDPAVVEARLAAIVADFRADCGSTQRATIPFNRKAEWGADGRIVPARRSFPPSFAASNISSWSEPVPAGAPRAPRRLDEKGRRGAVKALRGKAAPGQLAAAGVAALTRENRFAPAPPIHPRRFARRGTPTCSMTAGADDPG